MCGISVIVRDRKSSIRNAGAIINMNNAIKHRGPDDEGYLIYNRSGNLVRFSGRDTAINVVRNLRFREINDYEELGTINFGFRRLSIIDLSHFGHQPLVYMNRYAIVFNGEIYNYIEIRDDLKQKGYVFKTETDTEVILAAYDNYGVDCFNKFNGMWALVILDTEKKEIIAARDRFGIKPLYYYNDNNNLLFCSEIKQLIAVGGLNIQPDVTKITTDLLYDTREYTPETSFTNVYRFPKSHYLKLKIDSSKDRSLNFNRYYNLEYLSDNNSGDFDKKIASLLSEEYYSLLKDSVNLRLRSDVPIGTCFSGGLDSSSIVHCINDILKNANKRELQKTFSLVFTDPETKYCDESEFIDNVAAQLNLSSFKIEPTSDEVISSMEKMVYAMDTPQHSTLMSYIFTYQLVKQSGVTVTLDGQGADELQAGYLPYYRYYFNNNSISNAIKKINGNLNTMQGSNKEIVNGVFAAGIKAMGLKELFERFLKQKGLQTPFLILNEKLHQDFNQNLETLFHYGDRGSMINSVEARFPMMDYRLVEFWMKMPSIYKIYNGYTKYIARLAMRGSLPDEVVWRKDKKGWEMPQKVWIKNGLGVSMKSEITNSYFLKEIGIDFDITKIDKSYSDHRYWKEVIKIYNIALWYRLFFEEKKYNL